MKNFAVACDFSHAALNGIDYAARLASSLQRAITLVHIVQGVHPEVIEIQPKLEEVNYREHYLKAIAAEFAHEYHIYCGSRLELTLETLEETLANVATPYELLVMGTNGAENYSQHFFGSHTLNTMQHARCPVLMIPENVRYKPIKRIAFAYHPDTNPLFLIDQLREFTLSVGANLTVVHIATQPIRDDTDMKLLKMRSAISARATHKLPLTFAYRFARKDEVALALHEFMKEEKMDMLAVSQHHRTWWDDLLTEDVLKNLSRLADFPVMLFNR